GNFRLLLLNRDFRWTLLDGHIRLGRVDLDLWTLLLHGDPRLLGADNHLWLLAARLAGLGFRGAWLAACLLECADKLAEFFFVQTLAVVLVEPGQDLLLIQVGLAQGLLQLAFHLIPA